MMGGRQWWERSETKEMEKKKKESKQFQTKAEIHFHMVNSEYEKSCIICTTCTLPWLVVGAYCMFALLFTQTPYVLKWTKLLCMCVSVCVCPRVCSAFLWAVCWKDCPWKQTMLVIKSPGHQPDNTQAYTHKRKYTCTHIHINIY